MSYEKYFKDVSGYDVIDFYRAHRIFGLTDEVLCHASKKLLLSGVRTGGKTSEQDVREARDSLNRWLEMLQEDLGNAQEEDGWTPEATKQAEFDTGIPVSAASKDAYKEYTLQEVLGYAAVPDWVRWVVVDDHGNVFGFERRPDYTLDEWGVSDGACIRIRKVVPPISSENCIWEANFKTDCEYTLQEALGNTIVPSWVRWVAVDEDGEVYAYSDRPYIASDRVGAWSVSMGDECRLIKDIEPPADFTKCIWEIKK